MGLENQIKQTNIQTKQIIQEDPSLYYWKIVDGT